MTGRACGRCEWWSDIGDDDGFCHVNAPLSDENGDGYWPVTRNISWCGKFQLNEAEQLAVTDRERGFQGEAHPDVRGVSKELNRKFDRIQHKYSASESRPRVAPQSSGEAVSDSYPTGREGPQQAKGEEGEPGLS